MIAIGCDHGGFALKQEVMRHLDELGLAYKDFGTYSEESCDYPVYGEAVARAVAGGECERGILICGTGIGMSIAANKVPGAYAALVSDTYSAARASKSNDANIITLGAFVVGPALAKELVEVWVKSEYTPGGPSDPKVKRIYAIEEARLKEKGNS